jgi:hypothetical protein
MAASARRWLENDAGRHPRQKLDQQVNPPGWPDRAVVVGAVQMLAMAMMAWPLASSSERRRPAQVIHQPAERGPIGDLGRGRIPHLAAAYGTGGGSSSSGITDWNSA